MSVTLIMQTRMGSTRLPGKVMKELAGHPVVWHDLERIRRAKRVDTIILATTTNSEDDALETYCAKQNINCFRGSSDDVLARFYGAAQEFGGDVFVRVTSDCPLIDPVIIDMVIDGLGAHDYVTNVFDRKFPRGMDTEVFTRASLERAYKEATAPFDREHVTPFIREPQNGFDLANIDMPEAYHFPQFRLTLDTPQDYTLFQAIYAQWYKPGQIIDVPTILPWLVAHPEIAALNGDVQQKPDPSH